MGEGLVRMREKETNRANSSEEQKQFFLIVMTMSSERHRKEEVEKDVFIPFIHRPLSRYVNARAGSGLSLVRMEEPAPPPGFLARASEYAEAATIPRLLFLLTEKR